MNGAQVNEIIEEAFLDAANVLSQDKDCAKFFGLKNKQPNHHRQMW
jgi:hypothetical protein